MSNELVGNAEAAALLRIEKTNFCHLRKKRGDVFPEPYAELACGPVWLREDIETFKRVHYRRAMTARELLIEHIGRLSDEDVELVLGLLR